MSKRNSTASPLLINDSKDNISIASFVDLINEDRYSNSSIDNSAYVTVNQNELDDTERKAINIELEQHGISIFYSIWNLCNMLISNLSIVLPFYLSQGGIGLGSIFTIFYSFCGYYSILLIQKLCDKYDFNSFPEIATKGLGRIGFILSNLFILLANWAGAVGGFIIMGTIGPDLLIFLFGHHYLFKRMYVILFSAILFGPVAYYKNINKFAVLSLIAVWLQIGLFVAIIIRTILSYSNVEYIRPTIPTDGFDFMQSNYYVTIGGYSYLFTCSDVSVHIYKEPTAERWRAVVGSGMGLSLIISLIFAISGFVLFFFNCSSNILDNFARNDIMAIILRITMAFNVFVSIPYTCFMPRVVLLSLSKVFVPHVFEKENEESFIFNLFYFLTTTTVVVSASTTAVLVTNLGHLYSVLGGVSACGISLIIAPLCYLSLIGDDNLTNIICYIIIASGIYGCYCSFATLYLLS